MPTANIGHGGRRIAPEDDPTPDEPTGTSITDAAVGTSRL
jgi:hypothetical protein